MTAVGIEKKKTIGKKHNIIILFWYIFQKLCVDFVNGLCMWSIHFRQKTFFDDFIY